MSESPPTVTRGGGGSDSFAGLPDAGDGSMLPQDRAAGKKRAYMSFTLQEHHLGLEWNESGLPASDLSFGICELTPTEESRASANTGVNFMNGFVEHMKESLYMIGGKKATYDMKEKWLVAIGPKARKLLDKCFNSVNGIEEKEGEAVLASGTPVRG